MLLTEVVNEFGFQMHPIALQGREIAKNYSLPNDREATTTEIVNSTNSFLELWAIDEDSNRALTFSFPLAGRNQYADEIIQSIVKGTNHRYGDFGSDQTTVFIEDGIDPLAIVRRMLTAPIPFYENIQGLRAQADVLRAMEDRIFSSGGRVKEMKDIYNKGREISPKPEVKPYRPKLGDPFSIWDYVTTGQEAWALDMDDQIVSMTRLALDPDSEVSRVNPELRDSLLAIQKFLVEGKGRRIAISYSRDKTVEICCRAYTCSLVSNPALSLIKQQMNLMPSFEEDGFGNLKMIFGSGVSDPERNKICDSCNQEKTENHKCSKEENKN